MENNRNFFLTIALSVVILTLWQVFYMNPRIEEQRQAAQIEAFLQARQLRLKLFRRFRDRSGL